MIVTTLEDGKPIPTVSNPANIQPSKEYGKYGNPIINLITTLDTEAYAKAYPPNYRPEDCI